MVADALRMLPPQVGPGDESSVGLVGVVFDPDDATVPSFHADVEQAVRANAIQWTAHERRHRRRLDRVTRGWRAA